MIWVSIWGMRIFLGSHIHIFIISTGHYTISCNIIIKQLYHLDSHHYFKFIHWDHVLPHMWMQTYTELWLDFPVLGYWNPYGHVPISIPKWSKLDFKLRFLLFLWLISYQLTATSHVNNTAAFIQDFFFFKHLFRTGHCARQTRHKWSVLSRSLQSDRRRKIKIQTDK